MYDQRICPGLVGKIFNDCLAGPGSNVVLVEGRELRPSFSSAMLEANYEAIAAMLDLLPDGFKDVGSGGCSFLEAGKDQSGKPWAGYFERIDQLLTLGLAIGKVECTFPREIWKTLQGGEPFYVVLESVQVDNKPDLTETKQDEKFLARACRCVFEWLGRPARSNRKEGSMSHRRVDREKNGGEA